MLKKKVVSKMGPKELLASAATPSSEAPAAAISGATVSGPSHARQPPNTPRKTPKKAQSVQGSGSSPIFTEEFASTAGAREPFAPMAGAITGNVTPRPRVATYRASLCTFSSQPFRFANRSPLRIFRVPQMLVRSAIMKINSKPIATVDRAAGRPTTVRPKWLWRQACPRKALQVAVCIFADRNVSARTTLQPQ